MFDKERLVCISELDEAKIEQLDEEQLSSFATYANSLIDNFPLMQENIKAALEAKEIAYLSKSLLDISDILRQIYAERIAKGCLAQLKTINKTNDEDLQAFVNDFLKDVSTLSIDLQMAEYKEESAPTGGVVQGTVAKNTILAVDDRHFFLTAIKTMLQGTGYRVTCINSGAAALNYLNKNTPDLFILDIEMPEMDGYELAGRIRASGQTAPIIFLTGNANKNSVIKAIGAGAADFIIKPVTKEQLLERIGKYIYPEEVEEDEGE